MYARSIGFSRALMVLLLFFAGAGPASAQFIRIGSMDFGASTFLEAVYTTNVEQERESEADAEMEDYYLVWGFDVAGISDVAPNTKLTLDTGIAIEKHFIRDDLDNSERPFGRLNLSTLSTFGYWTLGAFVGYENTSESSDDEFVPGGGKKRKVHNTYDYGADLLWERNRFRAGGGYDFSSERYQDEEDQGADKDEETIDYFAAVRLRENMAVKYRNELTKTTLINNPEESDNEWLETETISFDGSLELIKRPRVTYSLGVEKEDTQDEEGEWEPRHAFSISDDADITPKLHLSAHAQYDIEQDKEEDDISFTYGVTLDHEISSTASQSLLFEREPVDTFASSTETDSTTYRYEFTKNDLFIYNLTFNFSATFEINEPLGGESPTEETWTYDASLRHTTLISRNIERSLAYEYSLENSNLFEEDIEEHRVTLTYRYAF